MRREIALHCMKSASELERELCEECPIYGQTGSDHCFEDTLHYVIGMLEQEPLLDKIRDEINSPNRGTCDYFIVDRIEEIIDRQKVRKHEREKRQSLL